ncbi:MAG: mechanosensitive ion channel [Balneolaceae bacterium]|nr:mechanosensitive ion channel [Balneolaceae bacterium]
MKRLVKRTSGNYDFSNHREQITLKTTNLINFGILILLIAGIWGLQGAEVITYMTSVLTVIGVAFFAQWSLLSNITSGLILFFSHPLKIGDTIEVVDKDIPLVGEVENISFYFLYIKDENGKVFTIPNSIAMQKTLVIKESKEQDTEITDQPEVGASSGEATP